MESNYPGADKDPDYERKAAERKAMFDEIRRRIIETNTQPVNRDEFLRKSTEIAERNRKRTEEWRGKGHGDQQAPDNAA